MRISLYILKQLLASCTLVTGVLCLAVWMVLSIRVIELALKTGASLGLFAQLMLALVPTFLPQVLPIGVMVGIIFTYNRLIQESELIVMRAAGLGPVPLSIPAIWVAGVATVLGFALTLFIAPASNRQVVQLQQHMRDSVSFALVREGQFNDFGPNVTIYVRDLTGPGELRGLIIHDKRSPDRPATLVAAEGVMLNTGETPKILVRNGTRQEFDRATGRVSELSFERYIVELNLPEPIRRNRAPDARERPIWELLRPAPDQTGDPRILRRMTVELHQRIVMPLLIPAAALVCLTILLGAAEHNRRGRTLRLVVAALICIGLQMAALALLNMGIQRPALVPLVYLPVLLPAVWVLVLWASGRRTAGPARPGLSSAS